MKQGETIGISNEYIENICLEFEDGHLLVIEREILEVRLILEIPAAKIAARVRNDVDLEQMDRCLSALSNVDYCDEKNYARGDEWNFLLHQAIMRTTGNGLLLRVYEGVASPQ